MDDMITSWDCNDDKHHSCSGGVCQCSCHRPTPHDFGPPEVDEYAEKARMDVPEFDRDIPAVGEYDGEGFDDDGDND